MPARENSVIARCTHVCRHAILPLLLLLLLSGCVENRANMLNAAGPAAARINVLWWLMFGLGALVYLAVMAYMLLALFRRRGSLEDAPQPAEGANIVVWGGAIIPALILIGVFGATVYTMDALREPHIPDDMVVEVVGHQWWWEVRYPQQQITTANEIIIPAGRPVAFKLTSNDVIHSFWVPELHGKLDLLPEKVNTFWLQADEPGVYLGECAEFCGVQHTKMQFLVIAVGDDEFRDWTEQMAQPAPEPAGELARRGQQVFLDSSCIYCHAVQGTDATGALGPDLTHLASRRTLAAGTVPNTRGNLAGWIVDPQSIKPGSLMPPTTLSGPDLQALLAYLETLE
ncbi:MAG TPA: cytochrome c oxidase subunit II [Candidatus Sulfomarinibacteraceae bacterium]|nr:cytochrome c oxidase subunit II [Candidatus Sulfomarinibacteraceae bacterium]